MKHNCYWALKETAKVDSWAATCIGATEKITPRQGLGGLVVLFVLRHRR